MIRHTRRASLLVAFSLLTSAVMVYPECAWVLWEGVWTEKTTPHEQSWAVLASWPSFGDCQPMMSRAAADRGQRWRPSPTAPSSATGVLPDVKVEGNQVSLISKAGSLNYTYLCLPDTVDPRGPKGK